MPTHTGKYTPYDPFQDQGYLDAVGGAQQFSADEIANLPPAGGTGNQRRRGGWQPGQFLQALLGRFNLEPMGFRKAFELQGYGDPWAGQRQGNLDAIGPQQPPGLTGPPRTQTTVLDSTGNFPGGDFALGAPIEMPPQPPQSASGGPRPPGPFTGRYSTSGRPIFEPTPAVTQRRRAYGKRLRPNMLNPLNAMFAPRFAPRGVSTKRNINR